MDRLGVGKGDGIEERVEWEKCEMGLVLGAAMGVGVGEADSKEGKEGEVGMRWDGHRLDKGDGRLVGWDVLDAQEMKQDMGSVDRGDSILFPVQNESRKGR